MLTKTYYPQMASRNSIAPQDDAEGKDILPPPADEERSSSEHHLRLEDHVLMPPPSIPTIPKNQQPVLRPNRITTKEIIHALIQLR